MHAGLVAKGFIREMMRGRERDEEDEDEEKEAVGRDSPSTARREGVHDSPAILVPAFGH